MPSARNCFVTSSENSASSRTMMRGSISICVTFAPRRAKHCASSQPIGPPPSTTRRLGSVRMSQTVSEVSGFDSRRPGIGGTKGAAPAAITMLLVRITRLVPSASAASTVQGEVIFAVPFRHSTPRLE